MKFSIRKLSIALALLSPMAYVTPEIPTNNTTTASTEIQPMPPHKCYCADGYYRETADHYECAICSGIFLKK